MEHDKAVTYATQVQDAIKHLDNLYVSVIIKENGHRQIVIREKGGNNG